MSTRDEYVGKMKKQLDEWNADLAKLETRAAEMAAPMRAKLDPQLAKARESYDSARSKLSEVREAGEGQWEKLTDEVEHVWKAMRQSINYFKSQL